ncbi:MAG: ABC transporter substrate-binding protein [Eubacteriales bacterium]|nr:ABC transporter substrate-binding protein [Eubacteriales bacterium]
MKKILALSLALVLFGSMLSGCGQKIDNSGYVPTGDALLMEGQDPDDLLPEEENTQELALAYYPTNSMNPIYGSNYTNRVLMSLMYQPLFAVDNSKVATPILAANYRVYSGGRTWVVYLESGARFSDGTPVTNEDVVATYLKAMENDYYKGRFKYHLSKVQLSDDGGVAFYLNSPFENLALLLDVPILKAGEVDYDGIEQIPVGSGPYTMSMGSGGAYLQRNHSWWCGDAEVAATDEAIELVEVSTPAEVRDEFQFGKVSLACTNPMSGSFAEYRCDYELWEIESGYFLYIGCNIQWSDFYPENHPLRAFLTYGIDRETYVSDIYRGLVDPVTLPCSPREISYNKTLASKYGFDSMKFLNELASFHIPTKDGGGEKELRILVNSEDSARVQIARNLAASLTELGMKATTMEHSGTAYQGVLVNGNYDIYLGLTRLPPTMDLSEFFRPWGEMSWGGLSHESLAGMCDRAMENSGNFYNLYQKVAEDGRIIPVAFGYYIVYAQRGVLPKLNPSRDNVFYYSLGKNMTDAQLPVEETE